MTNKVDNTTSNKPIDTASSGDKRTIPIVEMNTPSRIQNFSASTLQDSISVTVIPGDRTLTNNGVNLFDGEEVIDMKIEYFDEDVDQDEEEEEEVTVDVDGQQKPSCSSKFVEEYHSGIEIPSTLLLKEDHYGVFCGTLQIKNNTTFYYGFMVHTYIFLFSY
jgi:hypothetical protein